MEKNIYNEIRRDIEIFNIEKAKLNQFSFFEQELGPIQKKLVEALKSGNYKQGINELVSGLFVKTYCILGVACELASKENIVAKRLFNTYDDDSMVLPRKVQVYYEFVTNMGYINTERILEIEKNKKLDFRNYKFLSLSSMNDFGVSFNDLADLLEEFPWLFFKKAV